MYVGNYIYICSPTLHFDISCNSRSIGCHHIPAPSISYCISITWPYVYGFNFLRSVYKRLYIFPLETDSDRKQHKNKRATLSDAWLGASRYCYIRIYSCCLQYKNLIDSASFPGKSSRKDKMLWCEKLFYAFRHSISFIWKETTA
jgi:hypothetical protein